MNGAENPDQHNIDTPTKRFCIDTTTDLSLRNTARRFLSRINHPAFSKLRFTTTPQPFHYYSSLLADLELLSVQNVETMTDTPINIFPLNADEQSILHRLVAIRETLRQRKWDKTTYVRSQDVVADYNAVIEQVRELSALRKTDRWVPKDTRGMSDPGSPVKTHLELLLLHYPCSSC